MGFFDIVFDVPALQTFTYCVDSATKGEASVGKRVLASLGRRELVGYIIAEREQAPAGLDTVLAARCWRQTLRCSAYWCQTPCSGGSGATTPHIRHHAAAQVRQRYTPVLAKTRQRCQTLCGGGSGAMTPHADV